MSEVKKDWNALLKEPFSTSEFRKLYIKLNGYGLDEHTPWATIIKES